MKAIIKTANAQNISNQALNARDKQALIQQITILAIVSGIPIFAAACKFAGIVAKLLQVEMAVKLG